MNVFILCTGRCGSLTFAKACSHITNYTSAHESRIGVAGRKRLFYPENHIEVDNRLSWFLGRLDRAYGDDAFYVHLKREDEKVAVSFIRRYDMGIMLAYRRGMLMHRDVEQTIEPMDLALDYCLTVNSNITSFLKDKPMKMVINIETAQYDFTNFWDRIGAEGDIYAGLKEFDTTYNSSPAGGNIEAV